MNSERENKERKWSKTQKLLDKSKNKNNSSSDIIDLSKGFYYLNRQLSRARIEEEEEYVKDITDDTLLDLTSVTKA